MAAGNRWWGLIGLLVFLSISAVSAHEELEEPQEPTHPRDHQLGTYKHVWPKIRFDWKIVVGTIIAFLGAAFGSVGGVGGGGFFIPMLTLLIGFDQKSSIAVSKCMITGTSTATVLYNLRRRHPTLELPIIDYDLALLFQPLLVLGISIGVSLNVVLSDWMITILLFVVLVGVSAKSFVKGVETWKKETMTEKYLLDTSRHLPSNGEGTEDIEAKCTPGGPSNDALTEAKKAKRVEVSILDNVCWKELGVIVVVWLVILALQIAKNYLRKCSMTYWLTELLQIPVAVGVTSYQAMNLYRGRSVIASTGEANMKWSLYKLVAYCACGVAAGMLGGLLGLGGAFLLGPIFLEMGIPPQVSSATATFAMTFSSSMSVVEYYLLKRFPIPYALYFAAVTTISAWAGQHVAGKVVKKLGRASLIIFILAFTVFLSSLTLGGIGIENMIRKIQHKESLGFQNVCTYKT
ncbi:sulfite exporter TauE/SafE family protein 3-like isoform X1 [Rosa rugosa]|uniref:sulfite exporter TauE/SafE family protein 3-like isoform X1 n=1 Tax=Rosa rugosa TaxID=74645 RepID=UPI002B40672D|nr:sulfite exporter TauE/SafE family protein 3-like isoform X1 [Rosa rugosa]